MKRSTANGAGHAWLLATDGSERPLVEALRSGGFAVELFASIEELLLAARTRPVTVVLLAIEKATTSLSTIVASLTQSLSDAAVVVSCATIDGWEVRTALAAGATGIVCERDVATTLIPCLDAVCSGQVCVPRPYWRQTDRPTLSSRERQVLTLVADGCMNSEIAKRLFLSESTIKSHLSSAFGKLGVHSRNAAAELITGSDLAIAAGTREAGHRPEKGW